MGFSRRFHPKNQTGNRGEDEATAFLRASGYRILERNYRNSRGKALGEIDIVASDDEGIVFVEVKTRMERPGSEYRLPEENITFTKLRRLERVAWAYLREKRMEAIPYRFDAVSVVFPADRKSPEIRHLKSIFL